MSNKLLTLHKVSIGFDNRKLLKKISFSIAKGEVVCVLGESGCGKTSLLNSIQGLLDITSGAIELEGVPVLGPSEVLVPGADGIATVYQDFRLQEGLTIENNLKHELIHLSVSRQQKLCNQALRDCQLFTIKNRFPREVSGGQRQKLALAKALINEPGLILLDEPFSNLDNISKSSFKEVIQSLKEKGLSFLYVTHDVMDAVTFADRVLVIRNGKIEKNLLSKELFDEIDSVYLAQLLGLKNIVQGLRLNQLFDFNLKPDLFYHIPFSAFHFGEDGVAYSVIKSLNIGEVVQTRLTCCTEESAKIEFTVETTSKIQGSKFSIDLKLIKELQS